MNRNSNIELARLFATLGVISIHIHSNTEWAENLSLIFSPICVPFFITTSLAFYIKNIANYSIKNTFLKIWTRIAVPFLFWTLIYLFLFFVKTILSGSVSKINLWRAFVFGESAVHLYYLPTLIFLQTLVFAIFLIFFSKANKNYLYGFSLILMCAIYSNFGLYYEAAAFRNVHFLIGFLIYVAFVFLFRYFNFKSVITNTGRFFFFILILAIISFILSAKFDKNIIYPLLAPVCGISIFLLLISLSTFKVPEIIILITSTSYGVYLCHVVFLELFEFILEKVFFKKVFYDFPLKVILCILVFFTSILFVFIIRRIQIFRRLLLGE